jgi:hypothetical protein
MQIRLSFHAADGVQAVPMLQGMLECLTQHNEMWFRENPGYPCCLMHAGVQYVDPMLCDRDDFCQVILAASKLLEERKGTCADMAAYMAAWIRVFMGLPAQVILEQQYDEYNRPIPHAYHAYVVTNGVRYDPSEDVKKGICRCPGGAQ